ncbi:hypothetical protein F8M41_016132 [Gigaspora margarita]|uniref:C2H2-type domain-containing protein n=1 Tax=Gigaspora margarita TaxID=4874 RepID=A0A8H4EMX6_GIGMA|nr:hypothetical protein F8M41_016132 [Gigaspora margarita]
MFRCLICCKEFKTKCGLEKHNTIVQKYNKPRSDLDLLPHTTTNEYKQILIYWIQKHLPKYYKKSGKQTFLLACTESQFFTIFAGYIHYYSSRTRIYRCIFQGSDGYQTISKLLNNNSWGQKNYEHQQQTFVLLGYNHEQEENPLLRALQKKNKKKP